MRAVSGNLKDYKTTSRKEFNWTKYVGCSQSAVSKISDRHKQNGKVVKGRRTGQRVGTENSKQRV